MTRSITNLKKLVLAAFVGGATLIPTAAFAGRDHDRGDRYDRHDRREHKSSGRFGVSIFLGGSQGYGGYVPPVCAPQPPACERVWVEPVYRTECVRVWVEPVYRTECGRVWVEPVYDCRRVVVWDCGRRVVREERVLVRAGFWQTTSQQVLVTPGYWTTQDRQVLVSAGHWATRPVQYSGAVTFSFGR